MCAYVLISISYMHTSFIPLTMFLWPVVYLS